jgi:hypothetical protein
VPSTGGGGDRMAIGDGENLYVTTNCSFGGPDHKTLYITTQSPLYRVTLKVPGARSRPQLSATALIRSRVSRIPLTLNRRRARPANFQYRRVPSLSGSWKDSVTSVPSPLGSNR